MKTLKLYFNGKEIAYKQAPFLYDFIHEALNRGYTLDFITEMLISYHPILGFRFNGDIADIVVEIDFREFFDEIPAEERQWLWNKHYMGYRLRLNAEDFKKAMEQHYVKEFERYIEVCISARAVNDKKLELYIHPDDRYTVYTYDHTYEEHPNGSYILRSGLFDKKVVLQSLETQENLNELIPIYP